jgi:hypothetical protein
MKFFKYFALVALAAVPLLLIEKRRTSSPRGKGAVEDNLEPEIEWE